MHRHMFTTAAPSREAGPRSITKTATGLQHNLPVTALASRLDRQADIELFAGHHLRAEYLAQLAFALREERR